MSSKQNVNEPLPASGLFGRIGKRWRVQNVIMMSHDATLHTEGSPPNRRAKWVSVPYVLPDGRRGVWWQPYLSVRYDALDLGYTRARQRLVRVCRPNVPDQRTASTKS